MPQQTECRFGDGQLALAAQLGSRSSPGCRMGWCTHAGGVGIVSVRAGNGANRRMGAGPRAPRPWVVRLRDARTVDYALPMPTSAYTIDSVAGDRGASPKCFMHIPKSGGSSVQAALDRALPPGSLAPRRFDKSVFIDFDDLDLMRPEARDLVVVGRDEVQALGQYRMVSGHFSLTTLLQISDAASIATVLREPRARLLSLYMYWRVPNIGDFWAPSRTADHARRPLGEFLSEPYLAPVIDNVVCRMLLYGDARLRESDFASVDDIESLAADATKRLDALGFVGILELGEFVWHGLRRMFDVKLDPTMVNVTEEFGGLIEMEPEGRLLTTETVDLLEQRTAADLLVYDHALVRAGVDARERRLLGNSAFAHQLVKLGGLAGRSAVQVAEQAGLVEDLRSEKEEERRCWQAALLAHEQTLHAREQTIQGLEAEIIRGEEDIDRLRRWLTAVNASARWRLTTLLRAIKHTAQRLIPRVSVNGSREESLLAGWSVNQVWWFALALCTMIAATDAILIHVVLIAMLAAGPFCGAFTGQWARTAGVGAWALTLAVPLGLVDKVWDTHTQLIDLSAVAIVGLVCTLAATLIERRRQPSVG
jgi:hypothetical protein